VESGRRRPGDLILAAHPVHFPAALIS
jgi:hypothetical protein